jgi:hypothetical protein
VVLPLGPGACLGWNMTPQSPNGRVVVDADGLELIVERVVDGSASDIWTWLTVSEYTGRWIGTWTGTAAVGSVVQFIMTAEASTEPEDVTILVCTPGEQFLADLGSQGWRVGFTLAESDDHTLIFFTQRLDNADDAGSIGPGWEYYLDCMIAARAGTAAPIWDNYYPAFAPYYARLASAVSRTSSS